jgi:hypothetical protein
LKCLSETRNPYKWRDLRSSAMAERKVLTSLYLAFRVLKTSSDKFLLTVMESKNKIKLLRDMFRKNHLATRTYLTWLIKDLIHRILLEGSSYPEKERSNNNFNRLKKMPLQLFRWIVDPQLKSNLLHQLISVNMQFSIVTLQ